MKEQKPQQTIAPPDRLKKLNVLLQSSPDNNTEDELLKEKELFPIIALLTDLFASYMQQQSAYKRTVARVKYALLEKGFVRPLKRWFEYRARRNKDAKTKESAVRESLEHAFKYWWPREVSRPIESETGKDTTVQAQEIVTDKMLNGEGGQFVVEMQADDSLDLIPRLLRSQLYNMIISRRNFDSDEVIKKVYGQSESGMTVKELPKKFYYACVVRIGNRQKKFFFYDQEILDETAISFNTEFKNQLLEPSAWQEFSQDSIVNSSQAKKGRMGELTRQEVTQEQIDDRTNFVATDLLVTVRAEANKEPLSRLYQPQFSNNGANCLLGLHFAISQLGETQRVKKVTATSWHPQQDGAPLGKELQYSYAQAQRSRSPDDDYVAAAIEVKTSSVVVTTQQEKEKEKGREILEATIDAEKLYAATHVLYKHIRDRWFMAIGEKKYGAEMPVYQLLLYAVMMTLGIESAHQLVVDKSTGAVVPNVVGMPRFVQEYIKKGAWRLNTFDQKKAREVRTSLLSLACISKMDRSLINPDDGTFGTGLVRSTAVLVDKFRETAKLFGKIFNNNIARLINGTFLSSTLVPARKNDLVETGNGVGVTRFTTALSETHTLGGIGMTANLEDGQAKVHLALRRGRDFPSHYKGDFENDVKKNLDILLEYYIGHLGKISTDEEVLVGDTQSMQEKIETSKRKSIVTGK